MSRVNANSWSRIAARLTAIAHSEAPTLRWGILIALTLIWIGLGLSTFYFSGRYHLWEALYRTVAAVSMSSDYFDVPDAASRNAIRFAAIAVPVVGLVFAFSGALGEHLASLFNRAAAHHVVIAGSAMPALTLASDCRKSGDAVILIAGDLPDDTTLNLRRQGVIVVEGDATHPHALANARAHFAAHVVAFEDDDADNLQIEAAVRGLVGAARRRPPIGVHVSTRSPMLLREARHLGAMQMGRSEREKTSPAIDVRPFSLDEIAARCMLHAEAPALLDAAQRRGADRVHLLFFGFDSAAEAVAERVLASLWSTHFAPPRLTVLAPDHEAAEARFRARHREAFAHPDLWVADIAFLPFDWDAASLGPETLEEVDRSRGKITAVIVSTGTDSENIQLAVALQRLCRHHNHWTAIPILMKETSQSAFTREYAMGDHLRAFGAHQVTATRAAIVDGILDQGAAMAHEHHRRKLGHRASMRDLHAAMQDWGNVMEAHRAGNRGAADSAAVKLWDAGWRAAGPNERGEQAPAMDEPMMDQLARSEHARWIAERLMAGWRPGASEQADMMMHDDLRAWDGLSAEDRADRMMQAKAALDAERAMHARGFVRRT